MDRISGTETTHTLTRCIRVIDVKKENEKVRQNYINTHVHLEIKID